MTITECINYVDSIKPNAFTTADKINWLSSLDGRIALDIFLMAPEELASITKYDPTAENVGDTELLVSYPWDEMYHYYLEARIDEANEEYTNYASTMNVFNDALSNFTIWFTNKYEPASQDRGYYGMGRHED